MKQVEVTQITIKINDKEIKLTPAEARELQRVLEDTLGDRHKVTGPVVVPYPYPVVQPYSPYPYWEITWTANHSSTSGKLPACEVTYALAKAMA